MGDQEGQSAWMRLLVYWGPVVGYAGMVFFLSAQSHPEEQLPSFLLEEVSDKVLHAVEYGILALLCYRAFRWAAWAGCRVACGPAGDRDGLGLWHHG